MLKTLMGIRPLPLDKACDGLEPREYEEDLEREMKTVKMLLLAGAVVPTIPAIAVATDTYCSAITDFSEARYCIEKHYHEINELEGRLEDLEYKIRNLQNQLEELSNAR
jgi:peptidoglycan hydrolase CwlO-like protein